MFELSLPVAEMAVSWPLMAVLGLVLGMASAALGIGAGVVAVPVLFGLYGMRFEIAVGSSLALLVGNCAMGLLGHGRKGNVDYSIGTLLGVGVAGGALVGGWILKRLSAGAPLEILGHVHPLTEVVGAVLFSVLLLCLGVMTLLKVQGTVRVLRAGGADEQEDATRPPPAWLDGLQAPPRIRLRHADAQAVSVWPVLGVGLAAGCFAGMLGVGGGFLMVPVLLYWFRMRTLLAVGTSLLGILVGAIVGTAQKWMHGVIDWSLVGVLLGGGALGIPLGIWVALRAPPHELRRGYAMFCFFGVVLSLSKLLY